MKSTPFHKVMNRRATTMEKYLSGIVFLYVVIVALKSSAFFRFETLLDLVRGGSGTMILALGVLMVLISGGIDVSFTAIALVSAYSSVLLMLNLDIDNILFGLLTSVIVGTILGCLNALFIHILKLPTLIVTLGTMSVYHGAMAVVFGTKSYPTGQMPTSMVRFGSANVFTIPIGDKNYGVSVFLPIVLGLIILTWFILYRTMLGRQIFSIGSNEESASRLGISIFRTKLFVYSYSGALSGLMGVIYYSELKDVKLASSLMGAELLIIAAVVIGGAKLTGGEGTVFGAILGVVVFELFQRTLVFLGLNSSWNDLFFGAVLLASLAVMYRRQRVYDRDHLVFSAE